MSSGRLNDVSPGTETPGKAANVLPDSGSFVLVLARAAGGCGERTTMISVERDLADPGCSPHWAIGAARGWVHSTGVNSVERSSTDASYRTLTC
jgi:hypothetical protein